MKNSILLITTGLILLTGCSKDESIELIEEQTIETVHLLKQNNETVFWDTLALEINQGNSNQSNITDVHTDGYYMPTVRNGMTITWSGTQNGSGAFGRAELKQVAPNINFHLVLDTECVVVEGNEAVYGGTITQIKDLYGNAPNIEVGWKVYFKVVDSGQGGNVPYDQIANTTLFASPRSPSLCNVYPPDHHVWSDGYTDVVRPGFVMVNN